MIIQNHAQNASIEYTVRCVLRLNLKPSALLDISDVRLRMVIQNHAQNASIEYTVRCVLRLNLKPSALLDISAFTFKNGSTKIMLRKQP